MGRIKAVLFDLDQTLLDRNASIGRFLDVQWLNHKALQTVALGDFKRRFFELDANGRVWKDFVYSALVREFDIPSLKPRDLEADYVSGLCDHASLFPDVLVMLTALRLGGMKLGIITNGRVDMQTSMIEASGLGSLMDVVLISEAERIKKPDPRLFNRALERLGISASETVFVGDNPVADIAGAYAVGMRTVWKQNEYFGAPAPAVTSAEFGSFAELVKILNVLA